MPYDDQRASWAALPADQKLIDRVLSVRRCMTTR
jgi:hypothetical protein